MLPTSTNQPSTPSSPYGTWQASATSAWRSSAIRSAVPSPSASRVTPPTSEPSSPCAEDVVLLTPRPILIVHGDRDGVIPPDTARTIYDWAFEPKRLVMMEGADHGLREVRDDVRSLLLDWLPQASLS